MKKDFDRRNLMSSIENLHDLRVMSVIRSKTVSPVLTVNYVQPRDLRSQAVHFQV
jgi:hypothetical protein